MEEACPGLPGGLDGVRGLGDRERPQAGQAGRVPLGAGGTGSLCALVCRSLDLNLEMRFRGQSIIRDEAGADGLACRSQGTPSRAEVASVTTELAPPVGQEIPLPSVPNTIRERTGLFSLPPVPGNQSLVIGSPQLPAVCRWLCYVWCSSAWDSGERAGQIWALGSGCWQRKQQPQSTSGGQGTVGRDCRQVDWAWISACSQARAEPRRSLGARGGAPPQLWASPVGAPDRVPGFRGAGTLRQAGPARSRLWGRRGQAGAPGAWWGERVGQRCQPPAPVGAGCPRQITGAAGELWVCVPRSLETARRRGCASSAVGSVRAAGLLFFSRSVVSNSLHPTDCSKPGSPVLHYLLELTQTHVH